MNRRPPVLKLSRAITGFLQHKAAEALSPRTIEGYGHDLNQWLTYAGDVDVGKVTTQHIRAYLAWLVSDYKPRRLNGDVSSLSPKTIRNTWVSLAAFFRWASQELDLPNPMQLVPAPNLVEKPIEPYTKEDVETLLKASDFCEQAQTNGRSRFTMPRSTA